MIKFILNNKQITTHLPAGTLLLDYIRYNQHLTGTKIGCREGDCGACTILTGSLEKDEVKYQSATSCLTAIGSVINKHIVTIEGLNMTGMLNPIQQALSDEGGTQCGFCTPGFIVSMAGFCLSNNEITYENAVAAVDGNICRCTGYKSIQRALHHVTDLMKTKNNESSLDFVTKQSILPSYFSEIPDRLKTMLKEESGIIKNHKSDAKYLGGGTDLYVQQPEQMEDSEIHFINSRQDLKTITQEGNKCIIGGGATVTDLVESFVFRKAFPQYQEFTKLISSTPIRNIATISGNLVNASPIGDLSVFLLAINAHLILSDGKKQRKIPLRKFFKAYKTLDKNPEEFIEKIYFELPADRSFFAFEKICKRKNLDIATVNTAMHITINEDQTIKETSLSAGGIAPVPFFLVKASSFLQGKKITETLVLQAAAIAKQEAAPISDVRGSANYKRLLLGQLIKANFITLFSHLEIESLLINS